MAPQIRNYLRTKAQRRSNSHDGDGPVNLYEIWDQQDFKSNVDFFDRLVVPPGSNVGYHQHGQNEEMYIVLEGKGTMTIDGEQVTIGKGEMILNPANGTHGLVNDSGADIDLLIVQIGFGKEA